MTALVFFSKMKHNKITLSVSQLNNQAKFLLEKEFSDIWVEGEVSSVRKYSSGHTYFTLKDSFEISVVFFLNMLKIIN